MTKTRILFLLILAYLLLGTTYALVTPVFEASDELWHYPMIRHLADGNPLPVQVFDPDRAGPWKQEASQPPLYYYLGAAFTFWIDTSDMEAVRWLNPHVDNGLITEDGNINLVVQDPDLSPWQGTLLAVRIVRLLSVLLGAATVYLTFLIGNEVSPDRPEIGLGAAALNAFMPMFLFISGAVNNDNLAIPLASLAVLMMIRAVAKRRRFTFWLLLGVVIGLALLTKEGTFALVPLAWGTSFMIQWRQANATDAGLAKQSDAGTSLRRFAGAFIRSLPPFTAVLIPALLVAGWWYVRNERLYGDWLGWNAFVAVLGQRSQPASLAQLWGERNGFMMSYWGLFGGVNVPMSPWIYQLLNGVLIFSCIGFLLYLAQRLRTWRRDFSPLRLRVGHLSTAVLAFIETHYALVICALFAAAVIYGLIQWATTTWSSQGRLVFTAISALCTLMTVGVVGWMPPQPARVAATILAAFLIVIAAAAPFVWIRPAYRAETYRPQQVPIQSAVPDAVYSGQTDQAAKLRLMGAAVTPVGQEGNAIRPGDSLEVVLTWQVLSPMVRDWSTFVHLQDPVIGVPIAQRDMYPYQGLSATRLLHTDERWEHYYRLTVPETAVAPAQLEARVGWYAFESGERLQVTDGSDAVTVAVIPLTARPGAKPNPVSFNFGNELELTSFEIAPRRARPGELIELRLVWQALRPLSTDYTIFAQVVDRDTTRWASYDLAPLAGTSSWSPESVQSMDLPLLLSPDTPSGVYPLHLGAYIRTDDGGFRRLQLVSEDGRITQDDFLVLTQVRVD